MFARLLGRTIEADEEDVFWLDPENEELWHIANDLRWDFAPSTVINYIHRIVDPANFRETYRNFMEFADSAIKASRSKRQWQ